MNELIEALHDLVNSYREFDDDLDETACDTGSVTCPLCGGGGVHDGRCRQPIQHRPECKRLKVMEMYESWKRENQS